MLCVTSSRSGSSSSSDMISIITSSSKSSIINFHLNKKKRESKAYKTMATYKAA